MRRTIILAFIFILTGCSVPDNNFILIDKSSKKLCLYQAGQTYEFPIGVGKNPGNKQKAGDNRTPVGKFKIKSIKESSSWAYDFNDGRGPIVGAYGPWFIELDTPWQGIAIHGTHDPVTIGKNDSHGCVRMYNDDLIFLFSKITLNVPVEIIE